MPEHPDHEMIDWVIGKPTGQEAKTLREALDRAAAVLGGAELPGDSGVPGTPGKPGEPDAALPRCSVRPLDGTDGIRVDVAGARAVIRPSGTEPLLKTYVEAWTPPAPTVTDRADAERRLRLLAEAVAGAVAAGRRTGVTAPRASVEGGGG